MDQTIPALSLRQPWAWAILYAGKRIENRTWATSYRGRIRLHAAKTWDDEGYIWLLNEGGCDTFLPAAEDPIWFPRGAYVGEVTVADCYSVDWPDADIPEGQEIWEFGPVCWVLKDPIAYASPIPGRGYPGLYYPDRFKHR